MANGRGSASGAMALATLLMFLVFHIASVHAAVYNVGDRGGWTFNVVNWTNGKKFRAGDQLIFKYRAALGHDLVAVDARGYFSCTTPTWAKILRGGNDRIKLKKGLNYFICSTPGHCSAGMKMSVFAA